MWRPGLNYPQTNKLVFSFAARRTGRRLFLKLRRRARYVHQHFRSKPANLTLNREDAWMVLHDLTTHDGRAWNMQRSLGSVRWHDDHVYALYKLAANLEEPFRSRARRRLAEVLKFRHQDVPRIPEGNNLWLCRFLLIQSSQDLSSLGCGMYGASFRICCCHFICRPRPWWKEVIRAWARCCSPSKSGLTNSSRCLGNRFASAKRC